MASKKGRKSKKKSRSSSKKRKSSKSSKRPTIRFKKGEYVLVKGSGSTGPQIHQVFPSHLKFNLLKLAANVLTNTK